MAERDVKIVVLDGHTLTPAKPGQEPPAGEPSWDSLAELGELTVYDRTPPGQVVERAARATAVLTNKALLPADAIARLPGVRYIGVLATGVNVVDLAAAAGAGVTVTNVPGYSTSAVAQHVFALLLALSSKVAEHDAAVHAGRWAAGPDFAFTVAPLTELSGRTLGIIGFGDIGQRVAAIGHALGMRVLVHSRTQKPSATPLSWVTLDELLGAADAVTLHCPLTPDTKNLINAARLKTMRPGAMLINTGRGPLLDERAVADALRDGHLGGAAVDVLSTEPPAADNPLLHAPRCVITPHVAWAYTASRHRLMDTVVGNLRAFLSGQPQNVVKP